jgi:hypothetical protein
MSHEHLLPMAVAACILAASPGVDSASNAVEWPQWRGPARDGRLGGLAGGGVLFLLDTEGSLTVAAADASAFRPLRKWKVAASATWAHAVVLDAGVARR